MQDSVAGRLLALNHQFYQRLAAQFSATRQRLQPGVGSILERIPRDARLLDLGCGNGELARQLARRGFSGAYTGLDFSPALLGAAAGHCLPGDVFQFRHADLSASDWAGALGLSSLPAFDFILAFAVLHHLPGASLRSQVLRQARRLTLPSGELIHSEWTFLNSSRLRGRIQPWEVAGLSAADVDPGDYLLDWRGGGYGLRYVHHFSGPELDELAVHSGYRVRTSFLSDGEGGKLSLYQAWTAV